MSKISGLIFSADPIRATLKAAKHLLEFTDEVVVVYSKSYKDYKNFAAKNKDRRIKISYALRLGYPEPLRVYGINLCRYRNIAMLDVDERFSDTEYVRTLIDSNKADVYRLWRHEITNDKLQNQLYTKQYRLFKKSSLEWRGLLHETPAVKGTVVEIRKDKLCIIHKTGKTKSWNYDKINEVFPVDRPVRMAIRDAYVERGFKHLNMYNTLAMFLKRYKKHKLDAGSMDKVRKEIVRQLRKKGIINYLDLNKKENIALTNKKYKNAKEQGINLLIKLLNEKHEKRER